MPESNTVPPARWPAWVRVPPFLPVPVRARADGWTVARQGAFVGYLAETGCVAEAVRRAGMSRVAAYQLRARAGAASFAHAWDAVLAVRAGEAPAARNFTAEELREVALDGPMVVRMRRGRFTFARREPSDGALIRHLKFLYAGRRQDRRSSRAAAREAAAA